MQGEGGGWIAGRGIWFTGGSWRLAPPVRGRPSPSVRLRREPRRQCRLLRGPVGDAKVDLFQRLGVTAWTAVDLRHALGEGGNEALALLVGASALGPARQLIE